jgi:Ca-activated chloride channel family protein
MTFAAPTYLLALLAIPLVAAAYLVARGRRRRHALRFPAAAVLAGVSSRGSRARRLVAPVLLAAAAAALAVAAARPQATFAVPVEKASVMLITDESGSMSANDVDPSRLAAAASAAEDFLDKSPKSLLVGFIGYSTQTNTVIEPTQDHAQVSAALQSLQADGGTATGDALNTALDRLDAQRGKDGKRAPAAIVLLSDGKTNQGSDPLAAAQRAKQLGIPVSTVALGTSDGVVMAPGGQALSVPPDPATLQQISTITGGTFTETADASKLASVYKALGSKIGVKHVKREVSSSFAAAGAILLLAGLTTGLRRRSRVA